jgi:hypothetical protein
MGATGVMQVLSFRPMSRHSKGRLELGTAKERKIPVVGYDPSIARILAFLPPSHPPPSTEFRDSHSKPVADQFPSHRIPVSSWPYLAPKLAHAADQTHNTASKSQAP